MSSKSQAYAAYLKDIYAEYDTRADAVVSSSQIGLSAVETNPFEILGSMDGADIEAIAFLVLMQAAKSAQEDLKAIMDEVKAINQTKQRLRDTLEKLNASVEAALGEKDDGRGTVERGSTQFDPCATLDAELLVQLLMMTAARQSDREAEALASEYTALHKRLHIAKAAGEQRDTLDELSEMSELQQMRLQMIMDRRSKFMDTLSNIMKKMSDTQAAIIANMK